MNTATLPFEQDPPAQETLAGEYVLGVLDAGQRSEVEQRIANEPAFADEVNRWENRLAALAIEIAPVPVPDYVWARISSALGFQPAPRRTLAPQPSSAWENTGLWRWLSLGGFAVAAVCAIALLNAVRAPLVNAPVSPDVVTTPAPIPAPTPTTPAAPVEMASTLTRDDGKPGYVATMDAVSRRITVTSLQPAASGDKVPELWLIPPDGVARSLGVFADSATHTATIPEDYVDLLSTQAILAITLEPPGGAPGGVATGAVVAKGGIQLLAMAP